MAPAASVIKVDEAPRAAASSRRAVSPFVFVAGAAALVVAAALWGGWLDRHGDGIGLHAAPLFGAASNRLGPLVLVPLVLGALVVWRGPELAERIEWRRLLAAAFLFSIAWGVGLALVDHGVTDGLLRGVRGPQDFLADVESVATPASFLDSFTDRIDEYVVHVRGHPPALVVVLWWMRRFGLGGPGAFATVAIVAGSAAIVAALVACRELAGEAAARRAAPFLVLSPAAIWLVTSADALYAGLGAIGVASIVLASGRSGRADAMAAFGGLALGAGLFMSYGLLPLLLVPIAVAASRRRLRPLVVAGAAMLVVGVTFAAFGFSWLDGLRATRAEYADSIAALRPYGYFVFANIAAFAVTLGPAPVAGLATLRDRRMWLLVGAGIVAVLAADLSGLSKGEVERIWLPFWPWVALAACALASRIRLWLAAQAVLAIGVQTFLGTPW
jgi:hypothetical protein